MGCQVESLTSRQRRCWLVGWGWQSNLVRSDANLVFHAVTQCVLFPCPAAAPGNQQTGVCEGGWAYVNAGSCAASDRPAFLPLTLLPQEDLAGLASQPGLGLDLQGTLSKGPKEAITIQPEDGVPLMTNLDRPGGLEQCQSELSTPGTCLEDEGEGLGTDHLPTTEVALASTVASADYMEAVRSAATGPELGTSGQRTSAPASASSSSRSMTTGTGAGGGGIPASDDSGSGAGGTRAAGDSGSGRGGAAEGVVAPAAGTVPLPSGVPAGYTPLPLPLPLPALLAAPGSPSVPAGTAGGSCYRLPATRSIVWTSRSVVERCLDKGVPFAAMTEEQFGAVAAAAEQHDCALAYHLLSSTAVVFPGIGRHAASSGGAGGQAVAAEAPSSPASPRWRIGSLGNGAGAAAAAGLGLGLLGRRQGAEAAATAATNAARKVRALLYGAAAAGEQQPEEGEVALAATATAAAVGAPGGAGLQQLHVFSPAEYQRLLLAAQYGVRHLHEMLVAQPAVATTAAAALSLTPLAQTLGGAEPGDAAVPLPPQAASGLACSTGASVPVEVPNAGSPGGSTGISASPPTRGMGLLSLGSLLRGGGTGAGPTAAGAGSFKAHRRATSIGSDSSFSMAVTAGLGGAGSGPGGASGPLMSRFQSNREGSAAAAVVAALSPRSRSRKGTLSAQPFTGRDGPVLTVA